MKNPDTSPSNFSQYAETLHINSDNIRNLCEVIAAKGTTIVEPLIPNTIASFRNAYSRALSLPNPEARQKKLSQLNALSDNAAFIQQLRENGSQITDQDIQVLFEAVGATNFHLAKIAQLDDQNQHALLNQFEKIKEEGFSDPEAIISIHAYFAMARIPNQERRELFRRQFNLTAARSIYADKTPDQLSKLELKTLN